LAQPQTLCFGPFVFEPHQARLRRGRRVLLLTRKACEVLQYLVENAGQLVTKEALFCAIGSWGERPSPADYVRLTAPTDGTTTAGAR